MKWNIFVGSLVLGLGLSTQSFGDLLDRMLGMNYGDGGSKAACCETKGGCDLGCEQKGDPCCQKGCAKSCTPLLDKLRDRLGCKACQKGGDVCGKMEDPCCQKSDLGCEQKGDPCCQKGDPKGCEQKGDPCCQKGSKKCGTPLLDKIRCRLGNLKAKAKCSLTKCSLTKCSACQKGGCDLGCEQKGDPCCQKGDLGCGSKCTQKSHGSLLDRIFSCRACQKSGKCEEKCGKASDCGCDMGLAPAADAPTEAGAPEAAPTPPAPVVDPSAFLPTKRRFIQTTLVR